MPEEDPKNPPPGDPPPGDPPPTDPPPNNPDPQAVIADLQAQLEAATGNTAKAFDTTKAALRAANPDLPDAVFEAPDLATLTANVEAHKATAEHVRAQAQAAATNRAAANINPGGGTQRTPEPIPDDVRGIARIAKALERQQAAGG